MANVSAAVNPAGSEVMRSTFLSDNFRLAEATFLALGASPNRAAAKHKVTEVTMIYIFCMQCSMMIYSYKKTLI